jgi:hypothetical protein
MLPRLKNAVFRDMTTPRGSHLCYIPEDGILHCYLRENIKSYIVSAAVFATNDSATNFTVSLVIVQKG